MRVIKLSGAGSYISIEWYLKYYINLLNNNNIIYFFNKILLVWFSI